MLNNHPVPQHRVSLRPGFTLVEILVVLAIILILSGFVFGLAGGINKKQARTRAQTELETIGLALERYKLKYGDYPWLGEDTTGENLYKHLTGELMMKPVEANKPNVDALGDGNPLIDASKLNVVDDTFLDPWGNAYVYYYKKSPYSPGGWNYTGFILLTVGEDGVGNNTGLNNGNISADYFSEDDNVDNMVFGFEY